MLATVAQDCVGARRAFGLLVAAQRGNLVLRVGKIVRVELGSKVVALDVYDVVREHNVELACAVRAAATVVACAGCRLR